MQMLDEHHAVQKTSDGLWTLYRRKESVMRRSGMYLPLTGNLSADSMRKHLAELGPAMADRFVESIRD